MRYRIFDVEENDFLGEKASSLCSLSPDGKLIFSSSKESLNDERYVVQRTDGLYPDIPFLEKILAGNVFAANPKLRDELIYVGYEAEMFQQVWSSTAGGFEKPGMIAGCAMTTQYTTVLTMTLTTKRMQSVKFYGVFFDNEPAYIVKNATDVFFEDLKKHRMKSQYEAKRFY